MQCEGGERREEGGERREEGGGEEEAKTATRASAPLRPVGNDLRCVTCLLSWCA